jgi:glucose/arabinose dehydrogenase
MKMEKMHFVIALIMLILVAGCATAPLKAGGNTTNREAETIVTETTAATNQPAAPAAPAAVSYEITAETTSKLNTVFKLGDTMAVSEGSRKMSVGDSYVFAVGVGNPNMPSDSFQLKAELKKTYDKSSNSILSNLSVANSWLAKNEFPIKTIDRGGSEVFPFVIEIKNFVDGTAPKIGTYEFKLTALKNDHWDYPREEHASKTITIQIV